VPRYKFSWDNLPPELVGSLVEELHLDGGDPAEELKAEFGALPTEDFVREVWAVLEERWLNHDPQALEQVVEALWQRGRDGYRRPLGTHDQLGWLSSRNKTPRLRQAVLEAFIAAGERTRLSAPQPPAAVVGIRRSDFDRQPANDSAPQPNEAPAQPSTRSRMRRSTGTGNQGSHFSDNNGVLDVKTLETWLWDAACQIRVQGLHTPAYLPEASL